MEQKHVSEKEDFAEAKTLHLNQENVKETKSGEKIWQPRIINFICLFYGTRIFFHPQVVEWESEESWKNSNPFIVSIKILDNFFFESFLFIHRQFIFERHFWKSRDSHLSLLTNEQKVWRISYNSNAIRLRFPIYWFTTPPRIKDIQAPMNNKSRSIHVTIFRHYNMSEILKPPSKYDYDSIKLNSTCFSSILFHIIFKLSFRHSNCCV